MKMIVIHEIFLLKLSQAQKGQTYQIIKLNLLESLSKRLAILGINPGVFINVVALHKHGAVIKTPSGNIALGADVLDAIQVMSPAQ